MYVASLKNSYRVNDIIILNLFMNVFFDGIVITDVNLIQVE